MAPSQMEHQQEQSLGQGYTHKKFNCGYSHKKLGMRMRNRQQEANKENVEILSLTQQQLEQNKNSKPSKGLFRPYALDDENTPRKRKISRSSESSEDSNSSSTPQTTPVTHHRSQHQTTAPPVLTSSFATSAQTCATPALSPNSYAERLQRQRAALYMRYMSQFEKTAATTLQTPSHYATMGYPNVMAPIFNGC